MFLSFFEGGVKCLYGDTKTTHNKQCGVECSLSSRSIFQHTTFILPFQPTISILSTNRYSIKWSWSNHLFPQRIFAKDHLIFIHTTLASILSTFCVLMYGWSNSSYSDVINHHALILSSILPVAPHQLNYFFSYLFGSWKREREKSC